MREASDLLTATLQEESATDDELTALADKQVNRAAMDDAESGPGRTGSSKNNKR
jgi:ferritin-like metal-binding protein YciE